MATQTREAIFIKPKTKQLFLKQIAQEQIKGRKHTHDEWLQALMANK